MISAGLAACAGALVHKSSDVPFCILITINVIPKQLIDQHKHGCYASDSLRSKGQAQGSGNHLRLTAETVESGVQEDGSWRQSAGAASVYRRIPEYVKRDKVGSGTSGKQHAHNSDTIPWCP